MDSWNDVHLITGEHANPLGPNLALSILSKLLFLSFQQPDTVHAVSALILQMSSLVGISAKIWTSAVYHPVGLWPFSHHELLGEPVCLSNKSYLPMD
jgi:hypothetical protein